MDNLATMDSATTTHIPNVLTGLGFEKLSQGISFYQPSQSRHKDKSSSTDPTLVILCSWAFAQPKHIAKYLIQYQAIYPTTSILLVQNTITNAILTPDRWQMSFFEPAAAQIQAHVSTTHNPKVLVHLFSNGGSYAGVQLAQACRETCGGMRMPVDALLLDSCPGLPRFMPTVSALTLGVPSKNLLLRGAVAVLACATVGGMAICDILGISEIAPGKLYRKLNDPADSFLLNISADEDGRRRPVPRTYLYSKSDTMIMWGDVVDHAAIAREKLLAAGFDGEKLEGLVHLAEFGGTAHVNHIKTPDDRERYWQLVQETWRRR